MDQPDETDFPRGREPEVDRQIASLRQLPPGSFWAQIECKDKDHQDHVREEALVHLLRSARRTGQSRDADRLAMVLVERSKSTVFRAIRRRRWLSNTEVEDLYSEIVAHLVETLYDLGAGRAVEFWEIRYWFALKRLAIRVCDKDAAAARHTVSGMQGGGETEPFDLLENTAAPEPICRIDLMAARSLLVRLPPEERGVFYLYYVERVSQKEISERFGFTERTVYNRLRSAKKQLDAWTENDGK